jgi:Spherulation-specific family 4
VRFSGCTISLVLAIAVCVPAATAFGQRAPDEAGLALQSQRLLIPAYLYPSDPPNHRPRWRVMCSRLRLSGTRAVIVMNPADGDLDAMVERGEYPDYVEALRTCKVRRQRVIGYVTTGRSGGNGRRPLNAVRANVDRYYELFSGTDGIPKIDGIFFDEMANDPDKFGTEEAMEGDRKNRDYYMRLYNRVKGKTGRRIVVGNPGVEAKTDWQLTTTELAQAGRQGVADIVVTFEGPTRRVEHAANVNGDPGFVNGFNTYTPRSWTHGKGGRLAHLVYRAAKTPADGFPSITSTCQRSQMLGVKWVFVTRDNLILPDDDGPMLPIPEKDRNPWDTLPAAELLACPTLAGAAAAR